MNPTDTPQKTREQKRIDYCIKTLRRDFKAELDNENDRACVEIIREAEDLGFNAVALDLRNELLDSAGDDSQLRANIKKLIEARNHTEMEVNA